MKKCGILTGLALGLICCPLFAGSAEPKELTNGKKKLVPQKIATISNGWISLNERKDRNPFCKIVFQADSVDEITKKFPNAIYGDGTYIFIPQAKSDGKLTGFKAIKVWKGKNEQGKEQFYILKNGFGNFLMTTADMPLCTEVPGHDSGPGNYSILFSTSPWGAKLYKVNWELSHMGTGHHVEEHPFYLLQSPDGKWLWGGKGPDTHSGKSGCYTGSNDSVKTKVNWGSPDKLGYLSFERSTWYWDTGGGDGTRIPPENLTVYYESVGRMVLGHSYFDGKVGVISWVKAREGDTVDKIAKRVAVWLGRPYLLSKIGKIGKRYLYGENLKPQQKKDNEVMLQGCKKIILELNPKILEKPIQKGQKVYIDKTEMPVIENVDESGKNLGSGR